MNAKGEKGCSSKSSSSKSLFIDATVDSASLVVSKVPQQSENHFERKEPTLNVQHVTKDTGKLDIDVEAEREEMKL